MKDVYEEIYKRVINPVYIIILSLVSSLVILKCKITKLEKFYKFLIFLSGFGIIIISRLSYKIINYSIEIEIISLLLPMILVVLFYFYISFRSNFKISYL